MQLTMKTQRVQVKRVVGEEREDDQYSSELANRTVRANKLTAATLRLTLATDKTLSGNSERLETQQPKDI